MGLPPNLNLKTGVTAKLPGDYKAQGRPSTGPRTIDLPYPPSVNHYWRYARGHWHVSTDGQRYRRTVYASVVGHDMFHGRLDVDVTVWPPDRRRRDLDNVLKAVLDALAFGGVYKDDEQIDDLAVHRGPMQSGGAVRVVVRARDDGGAK